MKKISSKIIISLVLAAVLWGGGGIFSAKKTDAQLYTTDAGRAEINNRVAENTTSAQPKKPVTPASSWDVTKDTIKGTLINLFGGDALTIAGKFWKEKSMEWLVQLLYFTLTVLNIVFATIANIFDQVVSFTLYDINKSEAVRNSITTIWQTIRDTANIFFIFILLWISIKTIIGQAEGKTKKLLSSVIIAALLINFSLFITRVIIDSSNLLAEAVYKKVKIESFVGPVRPGSLPESHLGMVLMNNLGLASQYAVTKDPKMNFEQSLFAVIKIITVSIAIWAFIQMTLLFVSRLVGLLIIMAISPIGFIGESLPYLQPYAKKWWSNLIDLSLVAPIFLFLIWITIKLGSVAAFRVEAASQLDLNIYFNFIMMIALMIASVKITKKFAGEAGETGINWASKIAGVSFGLAAGGTASIFRNSAGRKATSVLEDQDLKDRAADGDKFAMAKLAFAKRVASGSFDIRATKLGDLTKKLGVDVRQGATVQKGGFAQTKKDAEKKADEEAKFYTENIDISSQNIDDERRKIDLDIMNNARKMADLNMLPTTQENIDKIDRLEEEKRTLENRRALDNEALKKALKEEKRKDVLTKLAQREEDKYKIGYQKKDGTVVGWSASPTSRIRAAKVRKAIKGQSDTEKLAELALKLEKERREKEATGTATTPATPAQQPGAQNPPAPQP